jgi:hypothetical protein
VPDAARHAVEPVISPRSWVKMGSMAKIPTSIQTSLWQRLISHAEQPWPQINRIETRYRAGFTYIDALPSAWRAT